MLMSFNSVEDVTGKAILLDHTKISEAINVFEKSRKNTSTVDVPVSVKEINNGYGRCFHLTPPSSVLATLEQKFQGIRLQMLSN